MRPLRLELRGFTAFRDPTELDFTNLDLFAIAGPTGAGKSSLLDAMTYALYGRVERVGDRVSQLVSQGQPRMAVTLEFEVGRDRYRVTRSTPPTKILLERQDPDGAWNQAGEGADRVREVDQRVAGLIGLTYDGFTRSVLLPQGTFAEFLMGDAKKRRDILTELLGLRIFERIRRRADAVARESSIRGQTMTEMLEREYADATAQALKEAKAAARTAARRERELAAAATRVRRILDRWREAERSILDLQACAAEAAGDGAVIAASAAELVALGPQLESCETAVEEARAASEAAGQALAEAEATLREAVSAAGTADDLAAAHVRAMALTEAISARAAMAADLVDVAAAAELLQHTVQEAEAALTARAEALRGREADLARAHEALAAAQHRDLVAAVSAGLKAGDPCPVCGQPLAKAPRRASASAMDKATRAAMASERHREAARAALADAERATDEARRDLGSARANRLRLEEEVQRLEAAIDAHQAELRLVLGDPLPDDPAGALRERAERIRDLDRSERDAARAAARAAQAVLQAHQELERVLAATERQRDRVVSDRGPLLERSARALAGPTPALPGAPGSDRPTDLAAFAHDLAAGLELLARTLADEVERRGVAEGAFLDEATSIVEGLIVPESTLEATAARLDTACKEATAEVATSARQAVELNDRLARKSLLSGEARELQERAQVFKRLALELRADRIIAFLQAEALDVLATAGSERLASLSDGRYRILCRDDEFFVVDTWNGDEVRSVRTLSGGETFLASLALALALSDQVRSLSVTDRARLDSLFLDEGFGSLDPESLRVVVDALEQLGGDGRLIGVITHVRDLAEQFPRIEVSKSPRGSRLEFVA